MNKSRLSTILTILVAVVFLTNLAYGVDEGTRNILKQGLLGAGTGAIAAGASGGKAGQGALIGAGTGVIGGALLDAMTAPSTPSRPVRRAAPPPDDYYEDEPVEYEEYYEEPPQESSSGKIIKQGLLGAGTGAIAAGASGGNAGQGALIGAGTGVIGGALLDTITQPAPQPRRRVYRRPAPKTSQTSQQNVQVQETDTGTERKKIIRKYDDTGKVVSEEEVYY